MKRIIGIILIAVAAVTGVWNFNQTQNEVKLSDLALANVEALARGEDQSGKICYYKGTSTYADYIPCTADYPKIGKCETRVNAYYSNDKGQCYE